MMDYCITFANWYDRGREYCTIFCNADVYPTAESPYCACVYNTFPLFAPIIAWSDIHPYIERSWCGLYLLGGCFFDRRSIFNTKMQARMLLLLSKQTNTINTIAMPCLMAINIVVDNIIII